MLLQLTIHDLAVVEKAELDFTQGMTIITGETGAGKSILLDALQLVLGARGDSSMIRPGASKTDICAVFDVSKLPAAVLWLSDCDLVDEPNVCILRRVIHNNGRSKAFINGHLATLHQLKALGQFLVQIHGQHQHQTLTQSSEQLRLLDAFGQHTASVSKVKKAFEDWDTLIQTKRQLSEDNTNDQARLDLLNYQIEELSSFALEADTIQALIQEHDQLANAHSDIALTQQALALLQSEEDAALEDTIMQAQKALKPLARKYPLLDGVTQCLDQAAINLKEATLELHHFSDSLEVDPERVQHLSNRLSQLQDIARKHRVELESLYEYQLELITASESLQNITKRLAQIDGDIALSQKQYQIEAKKLTQLRKKTALSLSKAATTALQNLGLQGATLEVQLKPFDDDKCHPHGNESIHFYFSANPGHPPQLLAKVASGGELSRVSLALELVTQNYLATPTLIFDEVDVGVGGKVGALVGKSLHELAKTAQVLCITHLPQVAAKGDEHFLVKKQQGKNSTQTSITPLNEAERIEELARMLGGEAITPEARHNAEALLAN